MGQERRGSVGGLLFGAGALATSTPCLGTKSRSQATYGSRVLDFVRGSKMAAAPVLKRPFLVGFSNFFSGFLVQGAIHGRFPRPLGNFQHGRRARATTAKTAFPGRIFKLFLGDSHVCQVAESDSGGIFSWPGGRAAPTFVTNNGHT